jgi:hypothetical protein
MTPVLDVDVTPISRPSRTAPRAAAPPKGSFSSYRARVKRSRWQLKRSKASKGEPVVTVADSVTGIFGSGSDPNEAIQDLMGALREHREVLESQKKLSPALKQQLKSLQR